MRVNVDAYVERAEKIGEAFGCLCPGENQPDDVISACDDALEEAQKFIKRVSNLRARAMKVDLSNA